MIEEAYIRKPAVAGMFYPAQPDLIKKQINEIARSEKNNIKSEIAKLNIIGGVVPHAGYVYSGYEAFHFFELVRLSEKEYETIVILNPDHQGYSPAFATSPHDEWETPLGRLPLDKELASYFPQSEMAHLEEHSAEVMLPFIQTILNINSKILPISIGDPTPDIAKKLARILFKAVEENNKRILIIASSDFSHYVSPNEGDKLDNLALEKIISLDSIGLYQTIKSNRITICGYGPIMTLIEYSLLYSKSPFASIAARGNSGKNSKANSVVDYITIMFTAQ